MKRLLSCFIVLFIGACTFISCDKEKNDLFDEKGRVEKPDTAFVDDASKILPLPRQQAIVTQTVQGLAQSVDFNNLAQVVNLVVSELGYDFEWQTALGMLGSQDSILAQKVDVLLGVLGSDSVIFDFDSLYFEADVAFKDTVIVTDTLTGSTETVRLPVIFNVNHRADDFKFNLYTSDGHKISLFLQAKNDEESRLIVKDKDKIGSNPSVFTLPDMLRFSIAFDEKTVASANVGYDTDIKVRMKGSGFNLGIDLDSISFSGKKIKLDELYIDGSRLSLDAGVTLDKYSLSANVNYNEDIKLLNASVGAQIDGVPVLQADANMKVKIDKDLNWADPSFISILSWASQIENFDGVEVKCLLGDQIKINASVLNIFAESSFWTFLSVALGGGRTVEQMNAIIDMLNRDIKGEVYFKDFEEPQAKIKFVYDPESYIPDSIMQVQLEKIMETGINKDVMKVIKNNLNYSGIRVLVDTYDARDTKAWKITVPLKDYLGGDRAFEAMKAMVKAIGANFKNSFAPVVELLKGDELDGRGGFRVG
jgi:hypothetical protein